MLPVLQSGNEIRIISPSTSMKIIAEDVRIKSHEKLEKLGLKITFGRHIDVMDALGTSPVENRLEDLHEAYADANVKAIMTSIGGFHANDLLHKIDYDLIRNNPKPMIGFSDITALQNAIYAKTGIPQFSGPHFSTLGMEKGLDYTLEQFARVVLVGKSAVVPVASSWSDDLWFLDQKNREFVANEGPVAVVHGKAEGHLVGGNLCTFSLLQGTPFMPSLQDKILFLEDDSDTTIHVFIRQLQSVFHQPGAQQVRALLVGRFQKQSKIDVNVLSNRLKHMDIIKNIPVVLNLDFGHTTPQMTLPIGGMCSIDVAEHVKLTF